jgi:hypothetical protein
MRTFTDHELLTEIFLYLKEDADDYSLIGFLVFKYNKGDWLTISGTEMNAILAQVQRIGESVLWHWDDDYIPTPEEWPPEISNEELNEWRKRFTDCQPTLSRLECQRIARLLLELSNYRAKYPKGESYQAY